MSVSPARLRRKPMLTGLIVGGLIGGSVVWVLTALKEIGEDEDSAWGGPFGFGGHDDDYPPDKTPADHYDTDDEVDDGTERY